MWSTKRWMYVAAAFLCQLLYIVLVWRHPAVPQQAQLPQQESGWESYLFNATALVDHVDILPFVEVETLQQGINLYRYNQRTPFVIRSRNTGQHFKHITADALMNVLLQTDATIPGASRFSSEHQFTGKEAVETWLNGTYMNILDSPTDLLPVPKVLAAHNGYYCYRGPPRPPQPQSTSSGSSASSKDPELAQYGDLGSIPGCEQPSNYFAVAMTSHDVYTTIHTDPPDYGGGWFYLATGVKNWIFISPLYFNELMDEPLTTPWNEVTTFKDLPPEGLKAMAARLRRGPLFAVTSGPGDFIMWPPGYLHKVYTTERAMGVGGYFKIPADDAYLRTYQQLLWAERQVGA